MKSKTTYRETQKFPLLKLSYPAIQLNNEASQCV